MKTFGVVGLKKSGKTTLIKHLISYFSGRGLSVSTIRYSICLGAIENPEFTENALCLAGSKEVIMASPQRWAMLHEMKPGSEVDMFALLGHMEPVDLVLVEGFGAMNHDKLLLVPDDDRYPEENTELQITACSNVRALVSNSRLPERFNLPVFPYADIPAIANLIADRCNLLVSD